MGSREREKGRGRQMVSGREGAGEEERQVGRWPGRSGKKKGEIERKRRRDKEGEMKEGTLKKPLP